jgi:hypothetical protein
MWCDGVGAASGEGLDFGLQLIAIKIGRVDDEGAVVDLFRQAIVEVVQSGIGGYS